MKKNIDKEDLKDYVKTSIKELIDQGYMFTAFDVTKMARKVHGKNVIIRHSDVNDLVKSTYNNGDMDGYARANINLGYSSLPFLYYPLGSDISNYESNWIESNPTQDYSYKPPSLDKDEDEDEDDKGDSNSSISKSLQDDGLKYLTKDGRLNIPIQIVKSCGMKCYDQFSVELKGDKLYVSKYGPTYLKHVNYVESDNRIRLCKSVMEKYFPANVRFKIESENGSIVVQGV